MGQPVGTPPPGGFGPGNGHQPPGQRGGPGFGPPPNQYGPPRPGGGRPDQNQQHQQHQQHQDDEDWDDEDDDLGDRIRGHSHGHGHTRTPVSAHTKRIVFAIVIPCMVATVVGLVLLWPGKVATPSGDAGSEQRAYGTITSVDEIPCPPVPAGAPSAGTANQPCGEAGVKVTSGTGSGTQIIVDLPQGPGAPTVKTGDTVVLSYTPAVGNDVPAKYQIVDHDRGKALIYVLALCGAIIIVFGRLRGFAALIALGVSFVILLGFILPGILNGKPPLLVAIVGSAAVMFLVLYLTHGFNTQTSVAVLGTLASLLVTGLLGVAFTATLKLTGFGSEESVYLSVLQGTVDMRGLLLAGIIIGALGVLDDMTVTQASTVAELAKHARSRMEVYRAATRIGRDHVASAVNTIVFAYAGASLPLLLLLVAGGRHISDLLTSEFITQEIVRTAVGTIGLVAAVPITTALGSLVADIRPRTADRRERAHARA
jgi:uncharacterized membrane protein